MFIISFVHRPTFLKKLVGENDWTRISTWVEPRSLRCGQVVSAQTSVASRWDTLQ